MKRPLVATLASVPILILEVALLTAGALGLRWITGSTITDLGEGFGDALFAAAPLAVLLTLAGRAMRPVRPTVMLLLVAASLGGLTVAAEFFAGGERPPEDPALATAIPDRAILHGGRVALYTGDVEGIILTQPAVIRFLQRPRIVVADQAYVDIERGLLSVPGAGEIPVDSIEVVRPDPPVLADLHLESDLDATAAWVNGDGAERFAAVLDESRASDPESSGTGAGWMPPLVGTALAATARYLVGTGAWLLAVTMVWAAARLTRWPLLNLALGLLYLRLLVAIPRLAAAASSVSWLEWIPSPVRAVLPSTIWAVLALVSIVTALVLPKLSRWQREMEPGDA